jgi:hypothetical protein
MFDTLLPLAPGLDVNDVVKNKAEDTHDNAEDTSMASPDNDRIVPVLKASPALLAKARNEYYDSIEAIPTYEVWSPHNALLLNLIKFRLKTQHELTTVVQCGLMHIWLLFCRPDSKQL